MLRIKEDDLDYFDEQMCLYKGEAFSFCISPQPDQC
ncbi:hypothetical protein IGB42_03332 [Andreprevotia sp. IGB-42]|nr:hypothetical protein IGB42_03332 [Andreprevotia sp. IGB-42]